MRRAFINLYILAAVVLVALICLAIISRNWSCREHRERDGIFNRIKREKTYGPYAVARVLNSTEIVCQYGRETKRREPKKELLVYLEGIEGQTYGEIGVNAAEALRNAVGESITIHCPVDRKHDFKMEGFVYDASGQCLQEVMLAGGWCKIKQQWAKDEPGGPSQAWLAAQEDAKKNKRGVWATVKSNKENEP